jgi:glycosyltransferase involved in cell wall biosynthesis
MKSYSIIICTRDRAAALHQTLRCFMKVRVPGGARAELIVVDNASSDETAEVVRAATLPDISARYLYEPKKGLSNARNAGIAAAQGEIIVFTDDDVVPAPDWLDKLVTPLAQSECQAVTGVVQMAPDLFREWMQPIHRLWLAAPDFANRAEPELTGANMAFHRLVLARVPGFDPELGAGALGFGEEALFCRQLREAGYRIGNVRDSVVVHHFEPSRLIRAQWLAAARKRGCSTAYCLHHWEHRCLKFPRIRSQHYLWKLLLRRLINRPAALNAEGCSPWEMDYVYHMSMRRHFLQEYRRPRNYEKKGLVRIGDPGAAAGAASIRRSARES